jgi:hypothetical protein
MPADEATCTADYDQLVIHVKTRTRNLCVLGSESPALNVPRVAPLGGLIHSERYPAVNSSKRKMTKFWEGACQPAAPACAYPGAGGSGSNRSVGCGPSRYGFSMYRLV